MIPTPIRQVLFTIQASGTRTLLMGGQACVFYGAAQVSKGVDSWTDLASTASQCMTAGQDRHRGSSVACVKPFTRAVRGTSRERRQQRDLQAAVLAVDQEVAIQSENHTLGMQFAHPHEAGIGQGHRQIGIGLQQLAD